MQQTCQYGQPRFLDKVHFNLALWPFDLKWHVSITFNLFLLYLWLQRVASTLCSQRLLLSMDRISTAQPIAKELSQCLLSMFVKVELFATFLFCFIIIFIRHLCSEETF